MNKLVLTACCFFLLNISFAQNLIRNGDFENGDCPETLGDSNVVCEHWYTIGSADYYSECSQGEANPHKNYFGHQAPHSGIAYVGVYSGVDIHIHNPEILFTELIEPLEKGYKYKISFWYSLSDSSCFISKSLGCALSNELAYEEIYSPVFGMGYSPIFELNYSLLETEFNHLSNDSSWNLFEKEFTASGNEKYLYISGVPIAGVSCTKRKMGFPVYHDYAYYYIDQVSLFKQNSDGSYPPPPLKVKTEKKESHTNSFNIYFDVGSYQLTDKAKVSLDTVVTILKSNPSWTIIVSGHTDASGTEKDNIVLSKNRSNVVETYLLSKGIERKRLEVQSLGSGKPFTANTSEFERAKNRRVEVLIKK